jgi:hypothetical protein
LVLRTCPVLVVFSCDATSGSISFMGFSLRSLCIGCSTTILSAAGARSSRFRNAGPGGTGLKILQWVICHEAAGNLAEYRSI